MNKLAPIVLFVYNRPEHTKQTVEALQKNELAIESELFIYSDAAKNISVKAKTDEVRKYIKSINGFNKVTVIKREKNWGLAASIIDGVTKIVNEYGKVIVLEDDLVASPYFLKFMNDALEFYKNEDKVWHVSGWSYPIEPNGLDDVFLSRLMNCWGWATWANRWKYFEKDVGKTIKNFDNGNIKRFNLGGATNFWSQVIGNKNNKIDTWAVFWYATIFQEDGLCLNPTQTFLENIGHDGSGVHCGENCSYSSSLSVNNNIMFVDKIEENKLAIERIQLFYKSQKKSLFIRIVNKFSRLFIGKNIIK
jgi:hypothetical protein